MPSESVIFAYTGIRKEGDADAIVNVRRPFPRSSMDGVVAMGKAGSVNRTETVPNRVFGFGDAEVATKLLMHDYHLKGDTTVWQSLLCDRSVWIGSGESMLFGGAAIRDHFREFVQLGTADILREEYHTLGDAHAGVEVVFGKLITRMRDGENKGRRYRTMFSCSYGMVDGSLKLLLQHYTYEWAGEGMPAETVERVRRSAASATSQAAVRPMTTRQAVRGDDPQWRSPQMRAAAYLVARNLSVTETDAQRIPVHSDSQVLYIDPRMVMYAESRNHRVEVVTLNKAFSCNITLSDLETMLPDYCCRVHRGYLVNAYYVTSIRRSEVELASGVVIPIPAPKYAATKRRLMDAIAGLEDEPGSEGNGDAGGVAAAD